MMEQVEEPARGRIRHVLATIAYVLRDVQRERAMRAQEAQAMDLEPRHLTGLGRLDERCDLCGSEGHRRALRKAQWVLGGTHGFAETGMSGATVLEPPQHPEQGVPVGCLRQPLEPA